MIKFTKNEHYNKACDLLIELSKKLIPIEKVFYLQPVSCFSQKVQDCSFKNMISTRT